MCSTSSAMTGSRSAARHQGRRARCGRVALNAHRHRYHVGALGEARARFTEIRGVADDWPDEEAELPAPEPVELGVSDQWELGIDDLKARCGWR
jgi:hypothetical protein